MHMVVIVVRSSRCRRLVGTSNDECLVITLLYVMMAIYQPVIHVLVQTQKRDKASREVSGGQELIDACYRLDNMMSNYDG